MEYETQDYTHQNTETGSVEIQTTDGSKFYYRNGGVDGHFDIQMTDYLPEKSKGWEFEGVVDGKFLIKGVDLSQIILDGKYVIFGNTDTGEVEIMSFDKYQNQLQ